jgi:hypothetical protein
MASNVNTHVNYHDLHAFFSETSRSDLQNAGQSLQIHFIRAIVALHCYLAVISWCGETQISSRTAWLMSCWWGRFVRITITWITLALAILARVDVWQVEEGWRHSKWFLISVSRLKYEELLGDAVSQTFILVILAHVGMWKGTGGTWVLKKSSSR